MIKLVTQEVPTIRLVGKNELDGLAVLSLQHKYEVSVDEFVLCKHGKEEIYVNKDIPNVAEIKEIINKVMKQKYLTGIEELCDKFGSITNTKAEKILVNIWSDWREERKKTESKNQADAILRSARGKQLHRRAKTNRELIRTAFDIGFGLYEEGSRCDFEKGAECAFMVGYYIATQNMN